jgi:predicted  nucleic acid-binding Zn-ribbon protein
MDPEVRKEFDEIRETSRRNEASSKAAFDRAMARMDRSDLKFERRHEAAMARLDRLDRSMEKAEKQIQVTRKLVEVGMKMMVELRQSQKANAAQIKATDAQIKATDAQLKALIAFHNGGHGRKHN